MKNRRAFLVIVTLLALAGLGAVFAYRRVQNSLQRLPEETNTAETAKVAPKEPRLTDTVVIKGLDHVWDVAFLPDQTMLFTERSGTISKVADGKKVVLLTVPNLNARGEGGLLGLTVDPDFAANHYIYACYDTFTDIRVSRWKVNAAVTGLSEKTDILTGLPLNTTTFPGRHSGCRPRFGADGKLWIGTGDVATGTNPQDPKSLGGKILHVDRDGRPAANNLKPPFDPRIYSYGHRNVQGLAMFEKARNGSFGMSVEHGTKRDDEVNALVPGNFGYNPIPGYNETVPMTDTEKYPDAITALWLSGTPTIATSGASFIHGEQWGTYDGTLAVAVLKDQHIRLLSFDDKNKLKSEKSIYKDMLGRIRSVVLGPDQALYATTDNGENKDMIVRIVPE